MTKFSELLRVYVWSVPVRLFHWINVLMIVILCITGFWIGHPPDIQTAHEASFGYWFGIIRFTHFAAGFIFFFNLVFRSYWFFRGNKYEDWRSYLPLSKGYFKDIVRVLREDILLLKGKSHVVISRNALQSLTYMVLFAVFIFQTITGFGLYSAMTDSWFPKLFDWIVPLLGGDFSVRFWHHTAMWVFIIFTIIHIYLVIYHDILEGQGEMSSIFSGYKFIEEEYLEELSDDTDRPQTVVKKRSPKKKKPIRPDGKSSAEQRAGYIYSIIFI